MNARFEDTSIVISYIQQLLSENYNNKVSISGEYYKHFDMNYGLAHHIAKYLNYTYPVLDAQTIQDYKQNDSNVARSITKPISIMNYFLCGNNGTRLNFIPQPTADEYETNNIPQNTVYKQIYNKYMVVKSQTEFSVVPRQ